jgi:hypothetical protein
MKTILFTLLLTSACFAGDYYSTTEICPICGNEYTAYREAINYDNMTIGFSFPSNQYISSDSIETEVCPKCYNEYNNRVKLKVRDVYTNELESIKKENELIRESNAEKRQSEEREKIKAEIERLKRKLNGQEEPSPKMDTSITFGESLTDEELNDNSIIFKGE